MLSLGQKGPKISAKKIIEVVKKLHEVKSYFFMTKQCYDA